MKRLIASAMLWLVMAASCFGANITVATVADLATARPGDGDVVTTLGYTTVGIGANTYRYDADSAVTVDYGFVINGPGSVGRYIAVDRSVARPEQFGAQKHSTIESIIFLTAESGTPSIGAGFDSTVGIQRCMDAADANEVNVVFEPGLYFVTDTIDLPTRSAFTATASTQHPPFKISGYGAEIRSNFNGPIFSHVPPSGEEANTSSYWTLRIEGFHLYGPYDFEQAAAKTDVIGIDYSIGYTVSIEDCRFSRCYQGIQLDFVINPAIQRCRFDECSNGIRCSEGGGGYTAIRECRFYSDDPQGIAYWFATSGGMLENSVCEGFRVKHAVRVGTDAAGGGMVQVRSLHLECPALSAFRVRLAQYHSFDVDRFVVGGYCGFLNATDSSGTVDFEFSHVYDSVGFIGLPAWSATSFAKYARVQHSGTVYIANVACVAGDVPGVSGNWTSEGDYYVCHYTNASARDAFSLTSSPTVDLSSWWLNASKWTGGSLPRTIRADSYTKDAARWGYQVMDSVAFLDLEVNSATPTVDDSDYFITANSSATTITDFVDRATQFDAGPWRKITILINDANTTIQHNANIQLNGAADFTPGASKGSITFISHSDTWYEVGRADY